MTVGARLLADSGIIPLGRFAWEFLIALGAAMAGGSLWALLRPGVYERRTGRPAPRPPDPRRVRRNVVIGVIIAVVGVVGLVGGLR